MLSKAQELKLDSLFSQLVDLFITEGDPQFWPKLDRLRERSRLRALNNYKRTAIVTANLCTAIAKLKLNAYYHEADDDEIQVKADAMVKRAKAHAKIRLREIERQATH